MGPYKVLLLDGIDPSGVELLERTGSIIPIVHEKISRENLMKLVPEVDGIIVRSATMVDSELLHSAARLRVVGRAGVGVDNVDIDAATERGVLVMNSPGGSTTTTAEHAIAMLFALARNIPQAYVSLKNGRWDKGRFKGTEITGKTLGVVGLGRIGSEVARKCQAMGMTVLAYDPFINPDTPLSAGLVLVGLEEIWTRADFITFHVPLTDETRDLVNSSTIARMKDGVRLVNCARAGIINESDLHAALKSGKIAGAALDVFDNEPSPPALLLTEDSFIATPHLGASTVEAQRKVSEDICRQVADFLLKKAVFGALNFPQMDAGQVEQYQHFVDLAGRMASFIGQISDGRIQSVALRYSGEVCDMNLSYLTSIIVQRLLSKTLREGVNLINAGHVARLRGIKVQETRVEVPENYTNLITIEIRTDLDTHRVSGTVFTDRMPRIVDVDGFALEVIPRGHMIYFSNNDKPGVIGNIGTVLGRCSVNIAGMQLGRDQEGGRALALLLVDNPASPEVIEQLLKIENILMAKAIRV